MPTYRVFGTVTIGVTMTVEAESAEAAKERAYEQYPGLEGYAGNGSNGGKLIGTAEEALYIEAGDDEPEFTDAEPE